MSNTPSALTFQSAELKARRGYKHIDELMAALAALPDTEAFKIAPREQHGDDLWFSFGSDAAAVADLALIIGDVAHNFRSAFDHIWNEIYRSIPAEGEKKRLSFPFHETRENLEDMVLKSPVKLAFPQIEGLVLDDLKPHFDEGGDGVLWSLTQLNNLDKHNLLIPTITQKAINSAVILNPAGKPAMFITGNSIFRSHSGRKDFVLGGGYKLQGDPKITVSALFPETAPAPVIGKDVVETLNYIGEAVRKAVELFRKNFG